MTEQPEASSKNIERKYKLVLLVKSLCEWNVESNSKCVDPPKYNEEQHHWM